MSVIRQISEKTILPELQATTKKEALTELSEAVHALYPELAAPALYETLRNRETLGSTGIGDGIAIPHGKIDGLDAIIILFGRSIRGVPFDAQDGKSVHLFFLLLAPSASAASYLSSLAEVSRFLKNPQTRDRLLHAASSHDLAEIFSAVE